MAILAFPYNINIIAKFGHSIKLLTFVGGLYPYLEKNDPVWTAFMFMF